MVVAVLVDLNSWGGPWGRLSEFFTTHLTGHNLPFPSQKTFYQVSASLSRFLSLDSLLFLYPPAIEEVINLC